MCPTYRQPYRLALHTCSSGCSHTPERSWQEFEHCWRASSSPQVLPSCEFLSPPLFASSSQPKSTIASNPLKEQPSTTTGSSKRRATGKAKTQDKVLGIIPQDLIAKLKASPVHQDKIVSKVVERQKGYDWSVNFTDGKRCVRILPKNLRGFEGDKPTFLKEVGLQLEPSYTSLRVIVAHCFPPCGKREGGKKQAILIK